MVDRNLKDFYGRVDRIERIHGAGGGFEAAGTLGMSHFNRRRRPLRRRLGLLAPLVLILCGFVVIKSAMLAVIGQDNYQSRITSLEEGSATEKAAAYVLRMDPMSIYLSDRLRRIIP